MTPPSTTGRRPDDPTPAADVRRHPAPLLILGGLPPELLAVLREATERGKRLTIVTISDPAPADDRAAAHPSAAPDQPLTANEVAAHYRVDPATVRLWCREGRFPGAERLGKSWQIPRTAVHNRRPPPAHQTPDAHPTPGTDDAQAPPPDPKPTRTRRGPTPTPKGRPTDHGFDRATLAQWRTGK